MNIKKSKNQEAEIIDTEETSLEPQSEQPQAWNNLDQDDVLACYLQICQKTSKAVEAGATPGSLIISQGEDFQEIEPGARMRVVSLHKKYERDLPYESDEEQQIFKTLQHAREEGFDSSDLREIYDIEALIQCDHPSGRSLPTGPKGENETWVLASARWRKSSCKAARTIATALNNRANIEGDKFQPHNAEFRLYITENKGRKNTYWTPTPRIVSEPVTALEGANPRLLLG